jgi:hypothetical protein
MHGKRRNAARRQIVVGSNTANTQPAAACKGATRNVPLGKRHRLLTRTLLATEDCIRFFTSAAARIETPVG